MTSPEPATGSLAPAALSVVLQEPEIPPNTGNIIRLCANIGAPLHLIEPLGFSLDNKRLRRAGLDYHEQTFCYKHRNLNEFLSAHPDGRLLAFSTKGDCLHWDVSYQPGDRLWFGPETRGLSESQLQQADNVIRLPMQPDSRSLNLSNAVAIATYEAWRQLAH